MSESFTASADPGDWLQSERRRRPGHRRGRDGLRVADLSPYRLATTS